MNTRKDDPEAAAHSAGGSLKFPQSRAAPPSTPGGFRDLGLTPLAIALDLSTEQTNGHWCSRCQGIWFGYTLEAQCPVCGNRNG